MKSGREYISHKCLVLSIMAMLGVVLIHSRAALSVETAAPWNVYLTKLICLRMTRWCVPLFFLISGFWFVRGAYSFRKKVKTLIVPYVCWAIIGAVVITPLVMATNVRAHQSLLDRTVFDGHGVWEVFDNMFAITLVGPVGCGVLWYVRSLLFCFLLAPLWRWLADRGMGRWVLLAWSVVSMLYPFNVPYLNIPSMALAWFPMGILCAKWNLLDASFPRWTGCPLAAAWGFLLLFGNEFADRSLPMLGCLFVVWAYDNVGSLRAWSPPPVAKETFWIYCSHQVIAAYFTSACFALFGKSDLVTFSLMFLTPPVVIGLSLAMAMSVKRLMPKAFYVLTGGRG